MSDQLRRRLDAESDVLYGTARLWTTESSTHATPRVLALCLAIAAEGDARQLHRTASAWRACNREALPPNHLLPETRMQFTDQHRSSTTPSPGSSAMRSTRTSTSGSGPKVSGPRPVQEAGDLGLLASSTRRSTVDWGWTSATRWSWPRRWAQPIAVAYRWRSRAHRHVHTGARALRIGRAQARIPLAVHRGRPRGLPGRQRTRRRSDVRR